MVSRVFVEKKPGFDVEAQQLMAELRNAVGESQGLSSQATLRIINMYDVEGVDAALFEQCIPTVFSEPQVDVASAQLPVEDVMLASQSAQELAASGECPTGVVSTPDDVAVLAVEALPGQFDQRASSAAECIQLISCGDQPTVRYVKIHVIEGPCSAQALDAIKHYIINPVETRQATIAPMATLQMEYPEPAPVEVLDGFTELDAAGLQAFINERGLAMDLADITFFQQYFRDEEKRQPTITEVKMVDTYWSDHCRHTTFGTELTDVQIDDP